MCEHCQKFRVNWDGLDKAVRQRMSIVLSQHKSICRAKRRASPPPSEHELYLVRKKQIESGERAVSKLMGAKVSSRGGQKKTPVKAKPKSMKGAKSSVPRQRAEKFIAQVKDRFKDKPSVFSDFLRLMKLYRGKKKSEMETVETVAMMFRNHKDLLQGFGWFC